MYSISWCDYKRNNILNSKEKRFSWIKVQQNNTADLEARVAQLEEDMGEVQAQVGNLEGGLALLSDEVNEVEDENTFQNERLFQLEEDLDIKDDEINSVVLLFCTKIFNSRTRQWKRKKFFSQYQQIAFGKVFPCIVSETTKQYIQHFCQIDT